MAPAAIWLISPLAAVFLAKSGLVEEAAALEQARTLLRRHFDVTGRQQEDLVRDALHSAVERVREAAGEVDQPLREILVGALQVEDHRDRFLELVGDLLSVVEAARDYEVDANRRRARDRRDPRSHDSGA